jgi:hypothetical protein
MAGKVFYQGVMAGLLAGIAGNFFVNVIFELLHQISGGLNTAEGYLYLLTLSAVMVYGICVYLDGIIEQKERGRYPKTKGFIVLVSTLTMCGLAIYAAAKRA